MPCLYRINSPKKRTNANICKREKVFREVAEAGWNGVEGIGVSSGDELVEMETLASSFDWCYRSGGWTF